MPQRRSQPEVIPESALLERDLARYDCIFLCNVAQFTASEARVLDNVLKRGGGLVFFLGDQVLADRYNRELAGEQGVRVLAGAAGRAGRPRPQYRFDPLDYRHPLVSVFHGREQSGLLDHAGLQVLSPGCRDPKAQRGAGLRRRRPGDRRGADPRRAARSWWPPRARCRRSIRRRKQSLDHDARLAQLRADRAGDCWPWPCAGRWPSTTSRSASRWANRSTAAGHPLGRERDHARGGARGSADDARRADEPLVVRRHAAERRLPRRARRADLARGGVRRQRRHGRKRPDANRARRVAARSLPRTARPTLDEAGFARRSAAAAACTSACCTAVLGLLFAETFLAWRFGHATR